MNTHYFPQGLALTEINEMILAQNELEFNLRIVEPVPQISGSRHLNECGNEHIAMFDAIDHTVKKSIDTLLRNALKGHVTLNQAKSLIKGQMQNVAEDRRARQLQSRKSVANIKVTINKVCGTEHKFFLNS